MEMNKFSKFVPSYILYYLSSLAKVSFIIGSKMAFFSLSGILAPVMGSFLGIGILLAIGLTKSVFSYFLGVGFLYGLTRFLPNIFSAFYFSNSSYLKVIVPVFAMIIFMVHPQGSFAYSLLWLIPIVCSFTNNLFARSLGATFSAHAVGSVIWLYTVPMTSALWLAIIPVALFERFVFAFGIYSLYSIVKLFNSSKLGSKVFNLKLNA